MMDPGQARIALEMLREFPRVVTLPFVPPYELWLRLHRHHRPLFAAPRDTFQYQAGPQFRGYGH